MNNRIKRLERAQLKVLFSVPFFAPGICRLPVTFIDHESEFRARFGLTREQVATACTDGKDLYWFGPWFDSLPDECLPTLLCHEACHCLLGHLWRIPPGGDAGLWNQACDHAVNLMMKEFSAASTSRGYADPLPFPPPHDAYCADAQFAGMAEEAIFARLNSLPKRVSGSSGNHGSGNGQNGGGSIQEFGQFLPGNASAPEEQKRKVDWEQTLIQAVEAAKGRGSLPGCLEKYVRGLVAPVVDWRDVLRSWLREQCADDWDFTAPAMEYSGGPFILPSMRSEKMGPVVFASDWSGSTHGDLVEKFHAEKQSCLDECRPSKLVDFGFDTRVVSQRSYVPGDTIDPTIKGGGGTSFVEVLRTASELHPRPKAVVVLTDLDGEFGQDIGIPTIWVTWTKGGTAPFGEVICAE